MTTVFYLSFLEREEFLPNFLKYFFLWCFHIIKKLEENGTKHKRQNNPTPPLTLWIRGFLASV